MILTLVFVVLLAGAALSPLLLTTPWAGSVLMLLKLLGFDNAERFIEKAKSLLLEHVITPELPVLSPTTLSFDFPTELSSTAMTVRTPTTLQKVNVEGDSFEHMIDGYFYPVIFAISVALVYYLYLWLTESTDEITTERMDIVALDTFTRAPQIQLSNEILDMTCTIQRELTPKPDFSLIQILDTGVPIASSKSRATLVPRSLSTMTRRSPLAIEYTSRLPIEYKVLLAIEYTSILAIEYKNFDVDDSEECSSNEEGYPLEKEDGNKKDQCNVYLVDPINRMIHDSVLEEEETKSIVEPVTSRNNYLDMPKKIKKKRRKQSSLNVDVSEVSSINNEDTQPENDDGKAKSNVEPEKSGENCEDTKMKKSKKKGRKYSRNAGWHFPQSDA